MIDRTLLRPLITAHLTGGLPLYEFRGRYYSGQIQPLDSVEDGLYQVISMHLAMYTVGTWPESTLKASIAWHVAKADGEEVPSKTPMWDEQWYSIMESGIAPWPIKLTRDGAVQTD